MNFDRVADIYDQTRHMPEEVGRSIANRVIEVTHANKNTRLLELGVGSGRIARDFLDAGFDVTGVDISEKMMERVREYAAMRNFPLTLVNADVADLPLPDNTFDIALTVHVFHLIPNWQAALGEARRVLKPDGYFVMGQERGRDNPLDKVRDEWDRLMVEQGQERPTRWGETATIEAEITSQNGRIAVYRAATWQRSSSVNAYLDALRGRVFSHTWHYSDEAIENSYQHCQAWATRHFADLDEPLPADTDFWVWFARFDQ